MIDVDSCIETGGGVRKKMTVNLSEVLYLRKLRIAEEMGALGLGRVNWSRVVQQCLSDVLKQLEKRVEEARKAQSGRR